MKALFVILSFFGPIIRALLGPALHWRPLIWVRASFFWTIWHLFLRERMIGLGPFLSGPSFFEILAPTLGLTRIFHVWELKVHLHNTTKFHLIIYSQFYSYIIYNYLYFNFILGCMFLNFPKPVGQNFKN